MRNLSDTLERLAAVKSRKFETAMPAQESLSSLADFGPNPGGLAAFHHVAKNVGAMPLVVVLHGCTQNAAGYDRGTGWTQLADELGFAVLFPEQTRANNPNLCFNWYQTTDNRRDAGEPMSIRAMVEAMVDRYEIDRSRIYVTGLSAGGAMTSVMLATYPDVFAGGAIIAGLPHGSAASMPEAFDRMRGHGGPTAAGLADLVSSATTHRGPWPTISVWHGSADMTVDQSNADAIVEQWRPFHRVSSSPDTVEQGKGFRRRSWQDQAGRTVIEDWRLTGMGHGTPVCASGADACGAGGPYMLDVGISSTREIARFWSLGGAGRATVSTNDVTPKPPILAASRYAPPPRPSRAQLLSPKPSAAPTSVGKVIEDALRAAGLMK